MASEMEALIVLPATHICAKCRQTLPLSAFCKDKSRRNGHSNFCRPCRTERRRAYQRDPQSVITAARRARQKNPKRDIAKRAVRRAIERGELSRPNKCDRCSQVPPPRNGRSSIEAHHDDYNKPLAVRWLCVPCHAAVHVELGSHGGGRSRFTEEQREQMRAMLARGRSAREVAARLGCHHATVLRWIDPALRVSPARATQEK